MSADNTNTQNNLEGSLSLVAKGVKLFGSINPYKPIVLFVGHNQTVKNAASGQVLHCLLTKFSFKV